MQTHTARFGVAQTPTLAEREYLLTTDLELLNRGTRPTFINSIRKEVIDITMVSKNFSAYTANWEVTDEMVMSDHRMITCQLEAELRQIPPRRNPRATNWEAYETGISENLESVGSIDSHSRLDAEVEKLEQTIINSYHKACPLRKQPSRKVRWWNSKLFQLKAETRRKYNNALKKVDHSAWEEFKLARREFKKEVRKRKRSAWQDFCGEIESLPESARLIKLMSSEGTRETIGSLSRDDGTWTSSNEEKLRLLLKTHFPGEAGAQISGEASASTSGAESQAQVEDWATAENNKLDKNAPATKDGRSKSGQ